MQTFKKYSSAVKASNWERPILSVNGHYVVIDQHPSCAAIDVIDQPSGKNVATVTVRHLMRLGNANHARPALKLGTKINCEKSQQVQDVLETISATGWSSFALRKDEAHAIVAYIAELERQNEVLKKLEF